MMPPRRAAILVALAVPALLAIGIVSVGKQVRSGNDFPIYWQAARTLAAGGSPYDIESGLHGYVYPPFLAILLLPLTVVLVRTAPPAMPPPPA